MGPGVDAPAKAGGRYIVVEEVGRGGMGRVLRAYDPVLQREVALKQVRCDVLGTQGAPQLVREARAMARLSHPAVVKVFDVEDTGEEVLLVMEYVEGGTLRDWLERKPSRRDTLAAFVEAGRGLAAAHEAGLLHRDFKPRNVLVAARGAARPEQVKVTDFGLARSVDDESRPTPSGALEGTLRYMAPEHHRARQLTPAADQFAYCVALWEALCGEDPYSPSATESRAVKKMQGPPAWSDTSTPSHVAVALRRGLEANPDARWPNMNALLAALTGDSRARRRRAGLVLAGGGIVLGATWIIAPSDADTRCTGALGQLAEVWDDARRADIVAAFEKLDAEFAAMVGREVAESLDEYSARWSEVHTEACLATTVRAQQPPEVMDRRMACLQRAKIRLGATVDVLVDADIEVAAGAHSLVDELPELHRCEGSQLDPDDEPPSDRDAAQVGLIRSRLATAEAARSVGRVAEAEVALDEALAEVEGVQYDRVTIAAYRQKAAFVESAGNFEEARDYYLRARDLALRHRRARSIAMLGIDLAELEAKAFERPGIAHRYLSPGRGLASRFPGVETSALRALSMIRLLEGDVDEARRVALRRHELLKQRYGPRSLRAAASASGAAWVLRRSGNVNLAESMQREVIEIYEEQYPEGHPEVANAYNSLSNVLEVRGDSEGAEAALRKALQIDMEALGPDDPMTIMVQSNLGNTLQHLRRLEEAEQHLRAATQGARRVWPASHRRVLSSRANLGMVLAARGQREQAIAEFREILALNEGRDTPDKQIDAIVRAVLAQSLVAHNRHEEAAAELRIAARSTTQLAGLGHPDSMKIQLDLAEALVNSSQLDEAVTVLRQASTQDRNADIPVELRARAADLLARAVWDTEGRPAKEQVLAWASRAEQLYTRANDERANDALRFIREVQGPRRP